MFFLLFLGMPQGQTTVWYLGTGQVCKATKIIINDMCNVTPNRKLIKTICFILSPVRECDKWVSQLENVTYVCHIFKSCDTRMSHFSYIPSDAQILFLQKCDIHISHYCGSQNEMSKIVQLRRMYMSHFGIFGQTFKMLHHAYFLFLHLET